MATLSIACEVLMLMPITLAVLLSFVLAPLAGLLRRIRLGQVPSVLLAVLLALGVILGLGGIIGTQVAGLANDIPRYASTIQDKVRSLQGVMVGRLSGMIDSRAHQIERAGGTAAERAKTARTSADGQMAPPGPAAATNAPPAACPISGYHSLPRCRWRWRRLSIPVGRWWRGPVRCFWSAM